MTDESAIDRLRRAVGLGADESGTSRMLDEKAETEFDIGLDAEAKAGTGEHDTGTGPDYDFERGPAPGAHESRPQQPD